MEEFRIRMSRGLTLVAVEAGREIAFGQLEPDDHLAFLYCSAENARRGIASAIYSALEAHARAKGVPEIRTEASRISRPFFEKKGYTVFEVEQVVRSGVEFERFRMRKRRSLTGTFGGLAFRGNSGTLRSCESSSSESSR